MIKELISICETLACVLYARKKELNNKLKELSEGQYACLVEEPTTSSYRINRYRGEDPSSAFTFAFVTPVPLQRDSLGNIDIIENAQGLCHKLADKLMASRRFRITDGAINGRKVEETEFDICVIGWRITVNLIDIKRVRC